MIFKSIEKTNIKRNIKIEAVSEDFRVKYYIDVTSIKLVIFE